MQVNGETAAFFPNRNGAKLFGMVHRPRVSNGSNVGAVFCHPMGWEKTFSYRAYVEFSRFLALRGVSSCRFDAFGFGDSDGDSEDATIRSQVDDVLAAIEWLGATVGCSRFVLIGVRLGAAIAALAAESHKAVEGLVLVSPVVKGGDYWKEWIGFSQFGRMSLGQSPLDPQTIPSRLEAEGAVEIDGEMVGRRFVEELCAIDLTTQETSFRGKWFLSELNSKRTQRKSFDAYAAALMGQGMDVTVSVDGLREFWVIKSQYESYVPRKLFMQTAQWLSKDSDV